MHLQEFWPLLTGLKWLHSGAVGLEHLLTPALVTSQVLLTNARGVYSQSLAEYVAARLLHVHCDASVP
jgi:phosphoglycerate dehydrogenase-like enzyme